MWTGACGESLVVLDPDEADAPADLTAAPHDMSAGADLDSAEELDSAPDLDMSDVEEMSAADLEMTPDMMVDMDADMDADMDPSIGVACSVDGRAGVCLDVASCDAGRVSTPGRCPGPANVQCCAAPPPVQPGSCDPSARPTPNAGLTDEPAGLGGCPAGMAAVASFCMDRWEAALVVDGAGGQVTTWSPYYNPGNAAVRAVSAPGLVPQGYISGRQAASACQRAGKRLCSDQEWLRACQGSPATTYPYGATRQPGVCNDARSRHPAVEYFGPGDPDPFSKIGHQCLNQLPDSLDRTGQNAGCVSADGIFDMMGNLHEWTADPAGTFRGGFYVDTYRNGNGCLYRTTAHDTGHSDYSTGFRCCADL